MRSERLVALLIALVLLAQLLVVTSARAQSGRSAPPAQPTTTLTLAEYRALLQDVESLLLRESRPDAILPGVYGQLEAVPAVEIAPGEVIKPVNLLRNVTRAEDAVARIQALQTQIDLSVNDRLAERQAIIQSVMSGSAYQEQVSLWESILEWLERLWEWLFPPENNPFAQPDAPTAVRDLGQVAGWVIAVVGGIAITLLLGWWGARLLGGFVRDAEQQRRRAAGDDMPASAAEARAVATAEARAGSFRQAVRTLYLSALLALEEGGIVAHDRTLTNRELLARAGGLEVGGGIQPAMQPVVQGFDDIWYGVVEPDAATYAAYEQEVTTLNQRIEEETRRRAGTPKAGGAS